MEKAELEQGCTSGKQLVRSSAVQLVMIQVRRNRKVYIVRVSSTKVYLKIYFLPLYIHCGGAKCAGVQGEFLMPQPLASSSGYLFCPSLAVLCPLPLCYSPPRERSKPWKSPSKPLMAPLAIQGSAPGFLKAKTMFCFRSIQNFKFSGITVE